MLPCAYLNANRFAQIAVQWYFGLLAGLADAPMSSDKKVGVI